MSENHAMQRKVSEVIYRTNQMLFPISWLHKREFCEYQIYLENVKGIKVEPTKEMTEGKEEHEQLFSEFKKKAVPATLDEMLDKSKIAEVFSRELPVRDLKHGIYGLVDEILLTPDEFIVIDDKPGTKTFLSHIHQIYGYCLAFKEEIQHQDTRPLVAALRERGTDNVYWKSPFNREAEEMVVSVVERVHALLNGKVHFSSSDNANKCRACRLRDNCDQLKTQSALRRRHRPII